MGAGIALSFAIENPDIVEKIVPSNLYVKVSKKKNNIGNYHLKLE